MHLCTVLQEKVGGENVWRIYSFQMLCKRMNRSAKGLLIVTTNLDWRITDDSPNLPNFLPAKLFCYMVYYIRVLYVTGY